MNKDTKENNQTNTCPEHDCYDWRSRILHNQSDANYESCYFCHRIIDFRWKSFWKRLKRCL